MPGLPRNTQVPHAVDFAIREFCDRWRPEKISAAAVLDLIVAEYEQTFGQLHQPHLNCLKKLTTSASGLPAAELEDPAHPFDHMQNELNRGLLGLTANWMQYQISVVEPTAIPRYALRPMSAFTIDRSPRTANASPHLRLAVAQYDRGDYAGCIDTIIGELPTLRAGRMKVSDATVLFYYLAKSLLKLNWYDLLDEVIAGPYDRFSDLAFGGDLDAERLQILAISMRQRGRADDSASCLRESIRLLRIADATFGHPSIAMTIADIHVLLAETVLDQVLHSEPTMQRVRLREADDAIGTARTYYERWWHISNTPVHYEGRLNGTTAFLIVASSLTEPERMTEERWAEADRYAVQAYEPQSQRKPIGIVAGMYAHAIVLLAKGRWYEGRQDPDGDSHRKAALGRGRLLLSNAKRLLDAGAVVIGSRYERPKLDRVIEIYDLLLSPSARQLPPWPPVRNDMDLLSPLI